jgi:hypothetical protein
VTEQCNIDYEAKIGFTFQFKKIIHGDSKEELRVGERLLAGSLAGATAQTIIYPMEVSRNLTEWHQVKGLYRIHFVQPFVCL